jgi:hypothetical protein
MQPSGFPSPFVPDAGAMRLATPEAPDAVECDGGFELPPRSVALVMQT